VSRRLCERCFGPLLAEAVGREPRRVVGYCSACDLVFEPELLTAPDYPRSSSDRTEL
jgi:hypothetical protein